MNDKIKELQKQIEVEKEKMRNCSHTFGKVFYNPEKTKEWVFTHYSGHGSDPFPEGYYKDKEIPRWTRICSECGQEEHTYKQKPIVTGFEPDFK